MPRSCLDRHRRLGVLGDLANWNLGRPPLDGDDVVFGGNPAWLDNTLDLSLTLGSFTFAADARSFRVHVAGDGGRMLAFDGLGIQTSPPAAGPLGSSSSLRPASAAAPSCSRTTPA